MPNIKTVAVALTEYNQQHADIKYTISLVAGDDNLLQITLAGSEEMPVYLSSADEQILCIVYLFTADQVKEDQIHAMQQEMLTMNIPMPLSSFAKMGAQYVIFGAMASNSAVEAIHQEIITLSGNSIEALANMCVYLK